MSGTAADWGERILSALGTGLVQGMLVASVVWLVLRLMRRSNAATRHAVQFGALGVVVALPILHFLMDVAGGADSRAVVSGIPVLEPGVPAGLISEKDSAPGLEHQERAADVETEEVDAAALTPIKFGEEGMPAGGDGAAGPGDAAEIGATSLRTANEPSAGATGAVEEGKAMPRFWQVRLPRAVVWVLTLGWVGIAFVRLGFLAAQCRALRRLKWNGVEAPEAVGRLFRDLTSSVGAARRVELRIVPGIASPMAVGYFRPAVLVPAGLVEAEGVDWGRMLRHELAHLRRWDDWTNLFQQIAKAVLFFQPAVHWLSRRLSIDREIACDDHVLSATGSPRAYALFLTEFARRTRGPSWTAAPGAWSNPSQLTERISMLLDTRRDASPRLAPVRAGAWMATVLLVAVFGLHAAPRFAVAGTEPGTPAVADDATAPKLKDRPTVELAPPPAPAPTPEPESVVVEIPVPEPASVPQPALAAVPALPAPPTPPAEPAPRKVRVVRAGAGSVHALSGHMVPGKPGSMVVAEVPVETTVTVLTGPDGSKATVTAESGETMERRLRRLEKMVAEMQRSGAKSAGSSAGANANANANANSYGSGTATLGVPKPPRVGEPGKGNIKPGEEIFGEFHYEGLAKVLAEVNQAVTQAAREAERAVRDAEKSMKLAARESAAKDPNVEVDLHLDVKPPKRSPEEAAAKALRDMKRREIETQRRVLQKQISELEGQLGRLEGQLDRLGDKMEKQVEVEFDSAAREQIRTERQRAQQKRRAAEIVKERMEHGPDRAPEPGGSPTPSAPKEKTKDKSGDRESEPVQKF